MASNPPTSTFKTITPLSAPIKGNSTVPGDKSISHRAILFSAMADGTSKLFGLLDSQDVRSSIQAVSSLGAEVSLVKNSDGNLFGSIKGWGTRGPIQPQSPIDCGNSGTTARLLMGVIAPWDVSVCLRGDESLCKRPMRRITAPLMKMGVHFQPPGQETLPLTEVGSSALKPINYTAPMSSAQLKTAVLLAGLGADGTTILHEPTASRNHTELMLPLYGAHTTAGDCFASIEGPYILSPCDMTVPGDPSSAAFLICAAALLPGSDLRIEKVSLNLARIGFVRTLEKMGADIFARTTGSSGKEPVGSISITYTTELRGCEVEAHAIAGMVDEIPVLSLVAAFAKGLTIFRGVAELRVKESNRLLAIIKGLKLIGIDAWEDGDDLYVEGNPALSVPDGLVFDSFRDHRLAMTWALVGLTQQVPVTVKDFDICSVSYPDFLNDLERLTS